MTLLSRPSRIPVAHHMKKPKSLFSRFLYIGVLRFRFAVLCFIILADSYDLVKGYKEGYSKIIIDKANNVFIEAILITRYTSSVPSIVGSKEAIEVATNRRSATAILFDDR